MGILEGYIANGKAAAARTSYKAAVAGSQEQADIMPFLQYPMDVSEPYLKCTQFEIRIVLNCTNLDGDGPLSVDGIRHEVAEYWPDAQINELPAAVPEIEAEFYYDYMKLLRYSFLPADDAGRSLEKPNLIYRLGGKPYQNLLKKLSSGGKDGSLKKQLLFMERGSGKSSSEKPLLFSEGSAEKIEEYLISLLEEIKTYPAKYKEKIKLEAGEKTKLEPSFILLFGFDDGHGGFVYPGEVPYVVKFQRAWAVQYNPSSRQYYSGQYICGHCLERKEGRFFLHKDIFKFATQDKSTFRSGGWGERDLNKEALPTLPNICPECFAFLSLGKREIERYSRIKGFTDKDHYLDIIAEPVVGEFAFDKVLRKVGNDKYIADSGREEMPLLAALLRHGESCVFHFLISSRSNSQVIIDNIIESVPPTLLGDMQRKWTELGTGFFAKYNTEGAFPKIEWNSVEYIYKKNPLKDIINNLTLVSRKSVEGTKSEKAAVNAFTRDIISQLVSGAPLNIQLIQDRFTRCLTHKTLMEADPDYKGDPVFKRYMPRLVRMLEFLSYVNEGRK